MKIKLTEEQFRLIESYVDEARKAPSPEKLSLFFNDNPNAQFFSVITRLKTGDENEFDFKFEEINGHKMIKDINKGTKTKGCRTDARFDTMIYGNKFKVRFGNCGDLTINNVVGLKVFADEQSLRSGHQMDSYELEHDLDKTSSEFVEQYYNEIKNAQTGDEIHFDSKFKWDGVVLEQMQNFLRVELTQVGRNYRPTILTIDLSQNPFYEEDGLTMFKSKAAKADKEGFEFIIPVKKFFVDVKGSRKKEEPKKEEPKKEPETDELDTKKDAKKLMDAIINDPLMKKAFYKQPNLWNLIMSAIKGENPKGTGILPAKQIAQRYKISKIEKQLGESFKNFSVNRPLTYVLISNDLSFESSDKNGDPIIFKTNGNYKATVEEIDVEDNYLSLYDKKADIKIIIKNKNEKERKPNTFNVIFEKRYTDERTKKSKTKSLNAVITISSVRGSGYFDYKTQPKTTK